MKIVIISLLVVMISSSAWANNKTQTVKGRLIDAQSHYPLIGVTIQLLGSETPKGTISDNDGYYKITNVPLGRVSLKFSSVGYEPIILNNILVSSGKETVIDVELKEDVIILESIEVESEADKSATNNEMDR